MSTATLSFTAVQPHRCRGAYSIFDTVPDVPDGMTIAYRCAVGPVQGIGRAGRTLDGRPAFTVRYVDRQGRLVNGTARAGELTLAAVVR